MRMLLLYTFFSSCLCQKYYVSTFAGSGNIAYGDGQLLKASFDYPTNVFLDNIGNCYVSDTYNNRVRKINSTGYVSTLAGNSIKGLVDGQGVAASFNLLTGISVDFLGNIFVSDSGSNAIRIINSTGYVSTLVCKGDNCPFNNPNGIQVDSNGNIFVVDNGNNMIKKINSSGYVNVVAGSGAYRFADGQDIQASFGSPYGIIVDSSGNLIVTDPGNYRIRKINSTGYVSTFAGGNSNGFINGAGNLARFSGPMGIASDASGNIYIGDAYNHAIRKIDPSGYVTTIAGKPQSGFYDGPGSMARFYYPEGLAVDINGNILVADFANQRIRKVYYEKTTTSTYSSTISCEYKFSNTISAAITPSNIDSVTTIATITPIPLSYSFQIPMTGTTGTSITTRPSVTESSKPRHMSAILTAYLEPEFTYSCLMGMLITGTMVIWMIKRNEAKRLNDTTLETETETDKEYKSK